MMGRLIVLLFLLNLGVSSCGDNGPRISIPLVYEAGLANLLAQSGVTARVWYRYSNSGTNVFYQPGHAKPAVQTASDPTSFLFHTASRPGYSISGGAVELFNLPLNQRGLVFGIEFIKQISKDDAAGSGNGYYVMAYGTFEGYPDKGTSKEVIEEVLAQEVLPGEKGLLIKYGRSCGRCTDQEHGNPTLPADAQLIKVCGQSNFAADVICQGPA